MQGNPDDGTIRFDEECRIGQSSGHADAVDRAHFSGPMSVGLLKPPRRKFGGMSFDVPAT